MTEKLAPESNSQTARYARLAKLKAYFDGKQYDGRADFFTGLRPGQTGTPVPLRERKPCVIYPLPKAATNQAVRFLFGKGRFPTFKVAPLSPADAISAKLGLSDAEAEMLSTGINNLVNQAGVPHISRNVARNGISCCTGVVVVMVRDGKFSFDVPFAKDCIPTFSKTNPNVIESMTICYRFEKQVVENNKPTYKPHYYRRDITGKEYITYRDAPAPAPGEKIDWEKFIERVDVHGLNVCPVVWTPNLREFDGDPDGCGIYEGLEDEFDALNFTLSQRHRGIHYHGTPQMWETGVAEDDGPGANGRSSAAIETSTSPETGQVVFRRATPESSGSARKMAPDQIWGYEGENVKLGVLETTGASFEAATKHVIDIRSRLLEAMDVVMMDPSVIAGSSELSARALEHLHAPLLSMVDELRDCWWTLHLEPLIQLMLMYVASDNGADLLYPHVGAMRNVLSRMTVTVGNGPSLPSEMKSRWVGPVVTPIWGNYFSPSNEEIVSVVNAAATASSNIVQLSTATRLVAPYMAIDDIEAEVDAVKQERKEQLQQEMQIAIQGAH